MVAHREGASFLLIPQRSEPLVAEDPGRGPNTEWHRPTRRMFRCEVRLTAEPEGGYSAYAPQLPGVLSEGESTTEAIRNMVEALGGALATYLGDSGLIPWKREIEPPAAGETRLWIVVNA